jgi:hypothetical protein
MNLNLKKPIIVAAGVAALGVSAVAGLGIASAATSTTSSDSLVDKIATKFNLKKSDVQAVFDQNRSDMVAQRRADMSKHLQTLVEQGKITTAQKTLIENKLSELKTAHETEIKALKAWADTNNVDVKYLIMGGRHGGDSDRLQSLVDGGKITAAQKTLIETKQAELKNKRDADRAALDKWASDNNIDTQYLRGLGGGHGLGSRQGGPDMGEPEAF